MFRTGVYALVSTKRRIVAPKKGVGHAQPPIPSRSRRKIYQIKVTVPGADPPV
jgi:hypothetical protein